MASQPPLVKLEIDGHQAKSVIDLQFYQMIEKLTEARKLFDNGKFSQAYKLFPYHHPLGENLEEFVNVVKDTNPTL